MNFMHSCKRVAELLSQRLDEPLSLLDAFRLRMHLSMCSDCSHVAQQLQAVHAASVDLFSNDLFTSDPDADAEPKPPTTPR